MDRAELGVDGNCGFALLGRNIQDGEAEFVEIVSDAPKGTVAYDNAAGRAAKAAYVNLKKRLGQEFSYYLGRSHPDYLP